MFISRKYSRLQFRDALHNPQILPRDFTNALPSQVGKTGVCVRQQTVQHVPDSLLTTHSQSVHIRPAHQHRLGTQRNRLQHVRPRSDAAVEQHRQARPLDLLVCPNLSQRVERANRPVELAAAVVGHDDAVHAV